MANIENLKTKIGYLKKSSSHHTFYFDDEIKEPYYYRSFFEVVKNSTEDDTIELIINTIGGYASTTIQIISYLRQTPSMTIARVYQASSAGSIITMSCKKIIPESFSTMMVHPIQTWHGERSAPEQVKESLFNDKISKRIIKELFKNFLTDKELNQINEDGQELNFDDIEMKKRFKKMGRLMD